MRELRETYHGVLMILRQFISKDTYTQNHSYRVSIYAARMAVEMGFDDDRVEDVRAAALLHDIGKLDISREILYKAARLNANEYEEMREHVNKGVNLLEPVGGSLRRVLPIILAHHDRFDGTGYSDRTGDEIPLEARILSVADAYDAITSDRPYRKGSTTYEAREILERGAGHEFDPEVVEHSCALSANSRWKFLRAVYSGGPPSRRFMTISAVGSVGICASGVPGSRSDAWPRRLHHSTWKPNALAE